MNLSPQLVYYSMRVLIMIYARFIACSEEGFCSKNLPTNFLGAGNFLKKSFFGKRSGQGHHNPKKHSEKFSSRFFLDAFVRRKKLQKLADFSVILDFTEIV